MPEPSEDQTERADWGAWLDRFEREVWPAFEARGYSKEAAAIIYFTRFPDRADTVDEDENDDEGFLTP